MLPARAWRAARDPSWGPARAWLAVQAAIAAVLILAAIVVSLVQGVPALPLTGLLGAALLRRDLRQRRASRPAVGPRPVWTVDGEEGA